MTSAKQDKCIICKKTAYLECSKCNNTICIRHRYYSDHKCNSEKEKIHLEKLIDTKNYTRM